MPSMSPYQKRGRQRRLQYALDGLTDWADLWGMEFNVVAECPANTWIAEMQNNARWL